MKFTEVPAAWKFVTVLAAAVLATSAWIGTLHTDAEASELWEQHQRAEVCRTVAQLKAELRELETRLQFDVNLTAKQHEWLKQQAKDIREEIRRYDPHGTC